MPFLKAPSVEVSCDDPKTCVATKPGKPPASDSNFMEVLEIEVLLPKDSKYAPVLDFYIYDSTMLPLPGMDSRVIIAYGNVPMRDYYVEEAEIEDDDAEGDEEDEEARAKRIAKEKFKKFTETTKELQKGGIIDQRGRKTLERFWLKKDEAVLKAFDQVGLMTCLSSLVKRA